MKKNSELTRRGFLGKATTGLGVAALSPYVITTNALGAPGIPPASERIVFGHIGVGGMGSGDMRAFMKNSDCVSVAVCDVDSKRVDKAIGRVNKQYGNNDCQGYGDFRELLARQDIDAVTISTPDHWHVLCALEAARSGKDMYVQKPLTLTIREGQELVKTVRRYGRVFQTGTQQRSDKNFRQACELVRGGHIGELQKVEVRIPYGYVMKGELNPPTQPIPEALDYDMWLGPAPYEPYTKKRVHFDFRWIIDYSDGMITDWGAHFMDIVQWGMGMDGSGPVEVNAKGSFPKDGLWDAADKFDITYKYANGIPVHLTNDTWAYVNFIGSEGSVKVWRGGISSNPESLAHKQFTPNDSRLYYSPNHYLNFAECVKSRRDPICCVEVGHGSVATCHLAQISMLLDRKLRWDPRKERFHNDKEANAMLGRVMRSPWTI
jgi:predicted dehydrogenase